MATAGSTAAPEVATAAGVVRGRRLDDGVLRFRGIPFAAAPVGSSRFRAPAPAPSWRGVRDAVDRGPTVFQREPRERPGLGSRRLSSPAWVPGDDVLNLNVWAPAEDAGPRPVLVWVHGGSYNSGSGSLPLYDGAAFARDGALLVTFNYRFGPDGFLCPRGATPNRGLLDAVAALRWVRDNIAAFGGDTDDVTAFGESSGATTVALLLTMPDARGLFRRAIVQSGAGPSAIPADEAVDVAERVARRLGCAATADALAEVPAQELTAAVDEEAAAVGAATDAGSLLCVPCADGVVVPADPWAALRDGSAQDVELLTGFNTDEANLFLVPNGLIDRIAEADLPVAARRWGRDPDTLLSWYRAALPAATPGELLSAMTTWQVFGSQTERLLETHCAGGGRGWAYEFAWRSTALGGRMGAAHSVELPFVFDVVADPRAAGIAGEAPPQQLADTMHGTWLRFAGSGDPGWQEWTPDDRVVRVLDLECRTLHDPYAGLRGPWGADNAWAPVLTIP